MRMRSPSPFFITPKEGQQEEREEGGGEGLEKNKPNSTSSSNKQDLEEYSDELDGLPLSVSGKHSVASKRVFHSIDEVFQAFSNNEVIINNQ